MITNIPFSMDTCLVKNDPDTAYNGANVFWIGESSGSADAVTRAIIVPDYSSIVGKILVNAKLYFYRYNDFSSNDRTLYAHRVLKAATANATWNTYDSTNAWGTVGCYDSSNDYDGSVVLGSAAWLKSGTGWWSMDLDIGEVAKFVSGEYTNNGIVLFVDTEVDDQFLCLSTEWATPSQRPYIEIEWTAPLGAYALLRNNRRHL